MSSDTIYQVTDLNSKRVEFVAAAKRGGARLRDKDGTSLVMLRESHVRVLEGLAEWTSAYLRLERLLRGPSAPSVSELGTLAWLRVFDHDDQRAFLEDLHDAIVAASADEDLVPVEELVGDWRTTAAQLADPLRRAVLLGENVEVDALVPAERP